MNSISNEGFKEATKLKQQIDDITHILTGLQRGSYYHLRVLSAGNDKSKILESHLGATYLQGMTDRLIVDLTLKRDKLVEEFNKLVDPPKKGTCDEVTDQEMVLLLQLMRKATRAQENLTSHALHVLVTIGKGMAWSQELDEDARRLADKVEKSLEPHINIPK